MTRVVVLGGGSGGEAFVGAISRLEGDFEVALVERALVGGECTFWACMPSKTLLRAPEILAAARQAPGAAEAMTRAVDVERVFWWRDQVVEGYEDEGHEEWLLRSQYHACSRRRVCEGAGCPRCQRAGTAVRQARHRNRLASYRAANRRDRGGFPLDDSGRDGVERGAGVPRRRRWRSFRRRARTALSTAWLRR